MLFHYFWHLSCLVLFELPGYVVWYLSLIWRNSQSLLLQVFLLYFSLFTFCSHYMYFNIFCSCTTVLGYSGFFCLFFSLRLTFGSFFWQILKLRDSFLSHVQSNNKPIKTFSFLLQCYWSLAFLFYSFLEFPSLSLHYVSVLACCLLFLLAN